MPKATPSTSSPSANTPWRRPRRKRPAPRRIPTSSRNTASKSAITLSEEESWSSAELRQDGRIRHHRRRPRRLRLASLMSSSPRRSASPWSRRRRPVRSGRPPHQRPQRQNHRHRAIHRSRLLHPLPRAGSRHPRRRPQRPSATARTPDKINLVYCEDALAAGDLFLSEPSPAATASQAASPGPRRPPKSSKPAAERPTSSSPTATSSSSPTSSSSTNPTPRLTPPRSTDWWMASSTATTS